MRTIVGRRKPSMHGASLGCVISSSLLPFLLNPSAHCQDVVSPVSAAIAVAETIDSPRLRFEKLAEIATKGYSEFEKQRGVEMLDRLRVQASDVAGASDRKKSIEAVAAGYIEIGEIDTAVDIHEQLGMTVDRIRTLLWWASRIRYRKQFEQSDRLVSHMVEAIRRVEIEQPNQREQLLASVSAAIAKNNHTDAALEIARSIPDAVRREFTLVEVAKESIPFRSPQQVLEIIADVTDQAGRTRVVLALISHLCENGQADEAIKYLELLDDDPTWQDRARSSIAVAYAEAGRITESEKIIAEIKEGFALALATKKLAPKLVSLGHIDKAREYANSVKDSYNRGKVLAEMGGASLSLGKDEEAMAFFNEAKAIEQSFDDPFVKVPLLETIARAAAENGKLDYSLQIAESMKGKGIQLIDKWEVLSLLAWKYLQTGNAEQAVKVARLIDEADSRNSSLSNIATNLAYRGKDAEGLELANQIPKGRNREYALYYIADVFACRKSFLQALEVTEKISDPDLKTEALSNLASNYAKFMEIPTLAETEILRRIIRDANRAKK